MAKNFRIRAETKNDQSVSIKLSGDFDATSACELMRVLDACVTPATKVAIDTDGLRMINRFGVDVILPRLAMRSGSAAAIQVTGLFSGVFQDQ